MDFSLKIFSRFINRLLLFLIDGFRSFHEISTPCEHWKHPPWHPTLKSSSTFISFKWKTVHSFFFSGKIKEKISDKIWRGSEFPKKSWFDVFRLMWCLPLNFSPCKLKKIGIPWMDGRMDGLFELMDGWLDAWIYGWMDKWMDKWMDGWK